jgi:hypothetical protein
MLYTTTVEPRTLGLLRSLMAEEPDLRDFTLVGGTALSLRIGHRQSYDLIPNFVAPTGIEPVSEVPETSILSIELRSHCLIERRKGKK